MQENETVAPMPRRDIVAIVQQEDGTYVAEERVPHAALLVENAWPLMMNAFIKLSVELWKESERLDAEASKATTTATSDNAL